LALKTVIKPNGHKAYILFSPPTIAINQVVVERAVLVGVFNFCSTKLASPARVPPPQGSYWSLGIGWVKLNKDNTFTISTQKVDDADVMPLQNFFSERDYISLLEVLSTVNRYSGFLDEFQHWQQRYHRSKPPQKTFYAGIIGLGCGIGTRKIAQGHLAGPFPQ
jgi:hypothetical protein